MQVTSLLRPLACVVSRRLGSTQQIDLSGVYPPVVTPFTPSGDVDLPLFKSHLQRLLDTPIAGLVVQGSNGEFAYLTPEEREQQVVVTASLKPKLLIAGTGMESTAGTVDLTNRMAAAGADVAMIYTPCFYRGGMTEAALTRHFEVVADSVECPIILYSVPGNTMLDLPVSVARHLASHDNIIGMKDSGGDVTKISALVHETAGQNFQVLAGSAGFLLPSLLMGAVGGVCALANVLPHECAMLCDLFNTGKLKEAVSLQRRLLAPNTAVTKQFGIAGLKEAMRLLGVTPGGLRPPLLPLSLDAGAKLLDIFQKEGFLLE